MGNRYWFRRRRGLRSRDLGWGYVPISWEGYLIVIFFILAVISAIIYSFYYFGDSFESAVWITVSIAVSIIAIVIIGEIKSKKE